MLEKKYVLYGAGWNAERFLYKIKQNRTGDILYR